MPDIPASLKPRLQTWWAGQSGDTQALLEAIYLEAPAAVSRAISGGTWVADSSEPGLSAQLWVDDQGAFDSDRQVPHVVASTPSAHPPYLTELNSPVTLTWTETNDSAGATNSLTPDPKAFERVSAALNAVIYSLNPS